jgi:two-component system, LuxR family, sensor kinase FixL
MKPEQKEFLATIFENTLDAVLLMDSKDVITGWNKQAELIFGWSHDEAVGRLMHETIVPERFRKQHIQGMRHFLSTGEGPVLNTRIEIFALHRDGHEFPVELAISPIKTADGYEFSSFIRDISERKRVEIALRENEEKLRIAAIAFESQEGMIVTDMNGFILRVNHAFTQLTGYSAEEVKGKTPAILKSGHHDNAFYQQMWAVLKQKHFWHGEIINRHKNGNIYIELLTISAVKAPDGSITHFIGSFSDITERKMMEKEILEQRNEMDFLQRQHIAAQTAAAIAHELNQPLLAIATYSEAALMLMNAEKPNSDKIRSAIEKCERQAQRAGQSIRELLELLSTKEFSTEAFDLNQEIFDVLYAARAEHELQFHPILHLENNLPLILANRTHVQKVLFNLLHNSIDAMRDAGVPVPAITVTVRTMQNESVAQVTIQDNGPGVKSEDFQRLFEPFFTTKTKGIGMGLAISRSLVEENGGQLWIDPQEGPGATFHLTLPFAT